MAGFHHEGQIHRRTSCPAARLPRGPRRHCTRVRVDPCAGDPSGCDPVVKAATSARTAPCATLRAAVTRLRRGYVKHLSPDISVIPREPNYIGGRTAPPHNAPWKTI